MNSNQQVEISEHSATRRSLLRSFAAGGALALGAPMLNFGRSQVFAADARKYSRRAIDLVGRSLVIDMLGVLAINDDDVMPRWLDKGMNEEEIAAFKSSGINVFHQSVGNGGPAAYENTLMYVAAWNRFIARMSDVFTSINTVKDMERAKAAGKIGLLIGLQNAEHFRKPDDVKTFHMLGQRVSQLTYNRQNLLGSGSTEREDGGVSDAGVEIIKKMNEVGMLVDVSHSGPQTTLDAIELSSKPIAFTHTNCKALVDHPRLKTDEAIKKLAAKGGVMGITGVRMFVRDKEPTTIEHVVDHIDHVVKLVGIEHVGIGTDADLAGYDALSPELQKQVRAAYKSSYAFRDKIDIEEFSHPRKIFDLTEALIRRGYSNAHIEAILGGNFKRLLAEVWGA